MSGRNTRVLRGRRGGSPARQAAIPLLLAVAPFVASAGEPKAGAYCPLPEPGKPATCLQPATQHYQEFFGALESGKLGDDASARLESEMEAGAGGERPYEALSSLAYGYYRLAKRAAATSDPDPEIQARLERWNALLARAYAASADDPSYRDAIRDAAVDVHQRAPAAGLRCVDAEGHTAQCDSTEALVRGIDAARDETGVRGQLARLFARMFGNAP